MKKGLNYGENICECETIERSIKMTTHENLRLNGFSVAITKQILV